MSSSDSDSSCSSGSELEATWEGEGAACSLFDDFASPFASEVYRHMSSKFGFDPGALGKGTLHRVALITYLERERASGSDVLECYRRVCANPSIVLERMEEFINPPFANEKLLWDFMESSDEEGDAVLLQRHLHQEPGTKTAQAAARASGKDEDYFSCYKGLGIHREMVLDGVRTGAYESFVRLNAHLFKDKVVLDVGCGSGILSLFAAKAGAKLVVGIDNCANLVSMATDHARLNGLCNTCFLHGKIEDSALSYVDGSVCFGPPPCDSASGGSAFGSSAFECDILISEWMGYGLFYENMLPSVLFARDRYLRPGGFMVPSRVKLGFFGVDLHSQLVAKLNEWREPKYGLLLSGLGYSASELLKTPSVDVVDPGSLVSAASGICVIDLHRVDAGDLSSAHDFEVEVHAGRSCSTLSLYFDCLFEPPSSDREAVPAISSLSSTVFGGLGSYRTSLPGVDQSTGFCTSPDYACPGGCGAGGCPGGVTVVMSTRPDQPATHWRQVLLHVTDHNDSPVRLEGTIRGRVSLCPNHANDRWLDILLQLRDSTSSRDCYYKLV